MGPYPRSRVGAQRYLEATQLPGHGQILHSCLPRVLVKCPHRCGGENTSIIRAGQGPPKRWVHVVLGARPEPAGHASIQKLSGTCKRSEKGFTPASSRELVRCRKPLREADVDKQQPVWSVTESTGSRSLSRMRAIQKAHVGLGSAGEEAAAGATVGRGGSGYFLHQGTGH